MPRPVNAEAGGEVVSVSDYQVTDDAVHDYLEATIGVERWAALTRGASPVPPFFAALVAQDAASEALTSHLRSRQGVVGIVQYDHDMQWVSPLRIGDTLASNAVVEPRREGPLGALAILRVDTRRCSGEPVSEMAAGILVIADGGVARQVAERTTATRTLAELSPGSDGFPLRRSFCIEPDQVDRYASVSGDRNPIHLDDQAARAVGLPGVIAHGLCVLASAAHGGVDVYAGGEAGRIRRVRARFTAPVFPGETVTTTYEWLSDSALRFRAATTRGLVLKSGRIIVDRR